MPISSNKAGLTQGAVASTRRAVPDVAEWSCNRPTLLPIGKLQIYEQNVKGHQGQCLTPLRSRAAVRLHTRDRLRRAFFHSVTQQSLDSGTKSGDKALTILEQAQPPNSGNLWLPDTFPLLSYKRASLFGSCSNRSSTEKFFKSLPLFMISHPSKSFLHKIKYL